MDRLLIKGGRALGGQVKVSGSKNAILPIMAASLMSSGEVVLRGVPCLDDISVMAQALSILGAKVRREGDVLVIAAGSVDSCELPEWLSRRMRASNLMMGALLGRCKQSRIGMPGGCAIGSRPMDLHVKGFQGLGFAISEEHGLLEGKAGFDTLRSRETMLDVPSVGATENIMMAAALTPGSHILRNAAREPEIVDLQNFLNLMGADIKGAGLDTIRIQGVERLSGAEYTPIPDRIEAGTYMLAAAISRGDVQLDNVIANQLHPVMAKLKEIGADVQASPGSVRVRSNGFYRCTDIKTMPYPGFPTDMQPQMMTLLATVAGTSMVVETIFENRFMHVPELRRMGADISLEGRVAVIRGHDRWQGAAVEASDLRAGAALILAGIYAPGETSIAGLEHVDRGYEDIQVKLTALGADVRRETAA